MYAYQKTGCKRSSSSGHSASTVARFCPGLR